MTKRCSGTAGRLLRPVLRGLYFLLCCSLFVSGCAVTGEPVRCKAGTDTLKVNAKVNASSLKAFVYIDDQLVITHHWPRFVNSRDEKTTDYKGHNVRSVLRIIQGTFGNVTVQIYVYIDDSDAVEFFF